MPPLMDSTGCAAITHLPSILSQIPGLGTCIRLDQPISRGCSPSARFRRDRWLERRANHRWAAPLRDRAAPAQPAAQPAGLGVYETPASRVPVLSIASLNRPTAPIRSAARTAAAALTTPAKLALTERFKIKSAMTAFSAVAGRDANPPHRAGRQRVTGARAVARAAVVSVRLGRARGGVGRRPDPVGRGPPWPASPAQGH